MNLAEDTMILTVYKEIVSVTRYYIMANTAPTIDETFDPSGLEGLGWSMFEPAYSADKTLYYVDVTRFSDGTWQYSPIGTSNSYEAAKKAAKQATNYIQPTGKGFIVGNMTDSVLGKNVLIDPYGVNIRNGGTVLASFGADLIELGKESDSAEIVLCNGTGRLTNKNDAEGNYKRLGIFSQNEVGIDSENFSVSASYAVENLEHNIDISAFTHLPWNPDDPLASGGTSFQVLADSWYTDIGQHNQAFLDLNGFEASAGLSASCGDTVASITLNGMRGLININGDMETTGGLMLSGNISAANLDRKSVTISGLPSGAGYTCYYYPVLKVCFLRLYYTGKAISATTTTVLGTVASGYRPSTQHALSIYPSQDTLKHRQAAISSDGGIKFYSEVAKDAADDTYITGFWFV